MRLPGRIAAAIEILADIEVRHRPAAEALRDWGLSHRFAGAGDRSAIGDLVYDALRSRLSLAWRMGGDTPWHLAVGAVIFAWGEDAHALNEAFAADPHAPPAEPGEVDAMEAEILRMRRTMSARICRNGSRAVSRCVRRRLGDEGRGLARGRRSISGSTPCCRTRQGGAAAFAARRGGDAAFARRA